MPGELFISGESECLSVEFSGVGVSVSMRMSGKLFLDVGDTLLFE